VRHPLSPRWRIVVWPLTALAFIGVFFSLRQGTLISPVTRFGLVDLELARTRARVTQIIAAWNMTNVLPDAIRATYLDLPFIVLYSGSLSLSTAAAAGALEVRRWPLARLGIVLSWGQVITVVTGGGENVGMLWQLNRPLTPAGPWIQITFICAVCKWTLALAGGLYSLYGFISWLTRPNPPWIADPTTRC